jgi:vacuolar-type H+-ATPase subunit E/Vma4
LRALARRQGINPKTVAKWRKRCSVADLPTGPKHPRSTVLTVEQEAIIVAFRKHTLLPLEAMGILALLTRHTPKDIADERERLQELLEAHQQHSESAQQNILGYVHELESRLAELPSEIEAGLDPKQIAEMLGESLRQHFLRSGVQDAVSALRTTGAAMTGVQKELSTALRALSDSHGGVVAQVERANNRIEYSLESRAKTMDALLHEWKSDLLQIWIPMVAGACMLIGLFGGVEIQGCRDEPAATPSTTTAQPTIPPVAPQAPARIPEQPKGRKQGAK